MSKIIKAARLAHKAHAGQKRDTSGDDYIKHPGRVAADLTLLDGVDGLEIGEDEVAAAWCHDTVEDTTVTRTDLERELGLKVAILVDDVTNRFTSKLCPNMNRATRKTKELERLHAAYKTSRAIKFVDRMDNLREIDPSKDFAVVYRKESEQLLEAIKDGLPTLADMLHSEIVRLGNRIAGAKEIRPTDLDAIEFARLRGSDERVRKVLAIQGRPSYVPVLCADDRCPGSPGCPRTHHNTLKVVQAALEGREDMKSFWS